MRVGTTITQLIIEEQRRAGGTGDFTQLMHDIVTAVKVVSNAVGHGALGDVLGQAGTENVSGEAQKKLDVLANEAIIRCNEWRGHVAAMASEELEGIYHLPVEYPRGKYLLLFDPLDGSSNIEVNGPMGTIFSILRHNQGKEPQVEDFLRPGVEQVGAGYALYGAATLMVISTGTGVHEFTLDKDIGEFILSRPHIRIPEDTEEFAINSSNARFWDPPVRRYIEECLAGKDGPRGKDFNMRWAGTMVADVHRILCRGGVFLYPADSKTRAKKQEGKLRLLYEASPMAFLVEQAGGRASTGECSLLEVRPQVLHQKIPVILGSKNEVELLESYFRQG